MNAESCIWYFHSYHPYWKDNYYNPNFDKLSGQILNVKKRQDDHRGKPGMNYYVEKLREILTDDFFVIIPIPSTNIQKPISGIETIVSRLCEGETENFNGYYWIQRNKNSKKLFDYRSWAKKLFCFSLLSSSAVQVYCGL